MNTTTTPNSPAAGLPRGIWIGGGLMAATIVALAATLVVKGNNDSAPGTPAQAAATVPAGDTTTAATPTVVAQQSQSVAPVNEAARPVHHTAPSHHESNGNVAAESSQQVAAAPVCASCGVIDGYSAVQVQGKNNGVGAVAGGVGGALLGSKIAGRNNHTLGGAIGAIGGGLLGNAIESHERVATVYDVRVRMADGSIRTVRQSQVPTVGQRVNVEGNTLRAIDGQG